MRPTLLCAALSLALTGLLPVHAGSPDPDPADPADPADPSDSTATEFDRITVTATRTERALADVPNTVDIISRERMDDLLVRDLKDLFRYEPGISVGSSIGRFGIGDIRIRGLGGNRVRIQTDGIAVPDAFAIGSFSNASRNFVDLDTLKRVEVVRGPTSSLYGSDALGGVVSFLTKDPSDYLKDGKDAYFGFKLGFESDWNGLFGGATAALGGERWSGLVAVGHRQGTETENQGEVGSSGAARTRPNPQQRDGHSLLSKLVYTPDQGQRFKLVVEGNEDGADTDLLTLRGLQPMTGANNLSVTADDHQTRARVAVVHEMDMVDAGFADSLDWQVYRQDSETTQDTSEERVVPASPFSPALRDRRDRRFNFDQRVYGLQANFRKAFEGAVRHDLAYGIDLSRTRIRQKRDGLRTFLDTGATTPVMPPDVFPVRDFPVSETSNAALYLQDEVGFAGGAFRLIPALRIDHYRLQPEVDAIFAEDNPGVAVAEISQTSVSPKLGAVWRFAPGWSLFGGYARGFRAPPYNDVNIGFTNVQFGYTAIANPDLRPETSDGLEAGLRYGSRVLFAELTGYYNRYDDFIESMAVVGFDPVRQLLVFQSRNVAEATIYGAEARAALDLGALSGALQGWSLRGAAAWSRGDNETEDVPLDGVEPPTASLGIAFQREAWGAELAARFVGRRDRLPSASDPQPGAEPVRAFESPGYVVLDLYAHWRFAPGVRLDAGLFNLGDRKYFYAGDVPLVAADSVQLDRYTAAGRNLALSVAVEW